MDKFINIILTGLNFNKMNNNFSLKRNKFPVATYDALNNILKQNQYGKGFIICLAKFQYKNQLQLLILKLLQAFITYRLLNYGPLHLHPMIKNNCFMLKFKP
ncbi:unnamed protein product (macronuclear) [Paramecium tetraurelia]|uniref:Uncharacterized protein n=1 Tax=Paramecium tetraurelia TaxID=5888 RepID=A0C2W8_PARTE|nr:uncharacterized protein GSPATT00034613001 [Paramecium tetraurelia]CAK65135.1 unnamed protein product [Paramecium tetraurelia]|eukprot:XP_001432532.1 hypothetical protein (macronuclear) [Paramecium tetraurelia strain d4-2]